MNEPIDVPVAELNPTEIGRFRIPIPPAFEWAGMEFVLDGILITEIPVAPGVDVNEFADDQWVRKLEEVALIDYDWPEDIPEVIRERRPLGENGHAVLYHGSYFAHNLMWTAMVETSETLVWFTAEFPDEEADAVFQRIARLAAAYVEHPPDSVSDTSPRFALQRGAVMSDYRSEEEVDVRLERETHQQVIQLNTRTTRRPSEPKSEFAEAPSLLEAGARLFGVKADAIRAGKRVVAGLEGREEIIRSDDEEGPRLHFWWFYAGTAESSSAPRFEIDFFTDAADAEQHRALWDRMLDGIEHIND